MRQNNAIMLLVLALFCYSSYSFSYSKLNAKLNEAFRNDGTPIPWHPRGYVFWDCMQIWVGLGVAALTLWFVPEETGIAAWITGLTAYLLVARNRVKRLGWEGLLPFPELPKSPEDEADDVQAQRSD